MELTKIYEEGEKALRQREFGRVLDGVETEWVLANNREIFEWYSFRQRCIDGAAPVARCSVLGVELTAPIVMSAMTMPIPAIAENGLYEVARGLKEAGSLMWTGTPIPHDLKALVETGVPLAANVKPFRDRRRVMKSLEEIQSAGVQWVGVEIDAGQGTKIGDRMMASDCVPFTLSELKEIREAVSLPLIFKGVLSGEDAVKAVEAGADGIMVSNHGAHTLDYLPHPLQVMEEILSAVEGKTVVMADGGFRRGSDVMKGLAFGASIIGLGRPILYGLAAHGGDGVRAVIEEITEELKRIMSMTGVATPGDADLSCLIENA